MLGEATMDAQAIVCCVNSHAELLAENAALAEALLGVRHGKCWCSEAERVRDFNGGHSPQCKAVWAAIAKTTGEQP